MPFHYQLPIIACVLTFLGPLARAETGQRYQFTTPVMGTQAKLICYAPDRQTATQAWNDVVRRWETLEEILSDYRPESEIMQLARRQEAAPDTWVPISPDLYRLLVICQDMSHRSNGAFDVTVGPLSRLWRQARRSGIPPSEAKRTDALASVGMEHLKLDKDSRSVRFCRSGMRLDFGAIGKGFAADAAIEILQAHGIHRALVDLGGDLTIADPPPDATGWRIAIAADRDQGAEPRSAWPLVHLENCGVATSGDAEQRMIMENGARRSHVLDPRTGQALTDSWTVTVVAANGTLADALASALSVMGPTEGVEWLDREFPGTAVQFTRQNDGVAETVGNEPFELLGRTTR